MMWLNKGGIYFDQTFVRARRTTFVDWGYRAPVAESATGGISQAGRNPETRE